jgi:hypothetical protein
VHLSAETEIMTPRSIRFVLSSALGLGGALGLSFLGNRSVAGEPPPPEPAPVVGQGLELDPELEAELEARYASLAREELLLELQVLREQILALHATLIEQRIAAGEFVETEYDPGMPMPASTEGVASGALTVTGPPGAKVLRSVIVPRGYDSQMDLLQQEYAWLSSKCGVMPGTVVEPAASGG